MVAFLELACYIIMHRIASSIVAGAATHNSIYNTHSTAQQQSSKVSNGGSLKCNTQFANKRKQPGPLDKM